MRSTARNALILTIKQWFFRSAGATITTFIVNLSLRADYASLVAFHPKRRREAGQAKILLILVKPQGTDTALKFEVIHLDVRTLLACLGCVIKVSRRCARDTLTSNISKGRFLGTDAC